MSGIPVWRVGLPKIGQAEFNKIRCPVSNTLEDSFFSPAISQRRKDS